MAWRIRRPVPQGQSDKDIESSGFLKKGAQIFRHGAGRVRAHDFSGRRIEFRDGGALDEEPHAQRVAPQRWRRSSSTAAGRTSLRSSNCCQSRRRSLSSEVGPGEEDGPRRIGQARGAGGVHAQERGGGRVRNVEGRDDHRRQTRRRHLNLRSYIIYKSREREKERHYGTVHAAIKENWKT